MAELQDIQAQVTHPTILVVDDDPAILKLCVSVLEQAGFSLLRAEGSSDALKICAEHQGPIDLLLTDLVLPPPSFQLASASNQFPHVHGHVLAARAASIRKGLHVALMSGNPDQDLKNHGIRRGDLPFLQKPFENAALAQFVREILANPAPVFDSLDSGKGADDVEWFG